MNIQIVRRSVSSGFVYPFQQQQAQMFKFLSTFIPGDSNYSRAHGAMGNQSTKPSESREEFEKRIFAEKPNSSSKSDDAFLNTLDNIEKDRDGRYSFDANMGEGYDESFYQSGSGSFNSLSDGLEHKLKRAATYFEFSPDEIAQDGYSYRPDHSFHPENTYELKELNLKRPPEQQIRTKAEWKVESKIALKKADFRNVRFLSHYISEAGLIIPRRKTNLSRLAHRRVSRAIRISRCFGLMPFTTQGTKAFVLGKSMQDTPEDFDYTTFHSGRSTHRR